MQALSEGGRFLIRTPQFRRNLSDGVDRETLRRATEGMSRNHYNYLVATGAIVSLWTVAKTYGISRKKIDTVRTLMESHTDIFVGVIETRLPKPTPKTHQTVLRDFFLRTQDIETAQAYLATLDVTAYGLAPQPRKKKQTVIF